MAGLYCDGQCTNVLNIFFFSGLWDVELGLLGLHRDHHHVPSRWRWGWSRCFRSTSSRIHVVVGKFYDNSFQIRIRSPMSCPPELWLAVVINQACSYWMAIIAAAVLCAEQNNKHSKCGENIFSRYTLPSLLKESFLYINHLWYIIIFRGKLIDNG